MKKLFFPIFILLMGVTSQAQDLSKHAIGLRLGNNDGLGYEISYQHTLSYVNRLQLDLGFRSSNNINIYKASGIYQWVSDLSNLSDGFYWFTGIGGGVGTIDTPFGNATFVNLESTVGIEYHFDFPLQLSLDTRPEIGIINGSSGINLEIALGVRYKF